MKRYLTNIIVYLLLCCCIISFVSLGAGCDQGSTNSFENAQAKFVKDGRLIIAKGSSIKSGFVVLGDASPPESKLSLILFAPANNEFSLNANTPKNVWTSIVVFEFNIKNKMLSFAEMRHDRGIKSIISPGMIFKEWEQNWNDCLQANGLSFIERHKDIMIGLLGTL